MPLSWWPALVTYADGFEFTEPILGRTQEHALERAAWNWPDAKVVQVGDIAASPTDPSTDT